MTSNVFGWTLSLTQLNSVIYCEFIAYLFTVFFLTLYSLLT